MRLSITLACQMDFKSYPFDWQICPLEMESYGYKVSEIFFEWNQNGPPIDIPTGIKLPNHRMRGHLIDDCTKTYKTGRFTCISGKIDSFDCFCSL